MTLTAHQRLPRWMNTYIFSLGSLEIRILAGFANGLSVICDLVIAASLYIYLNSKRTGFRRYVYAIAFTLQYEAEMTFSCAEPTRSSTA